MPFLLLVWNLDDELNLGACVIYCFSLFSFFFKIYFRGGESGLIKGKYR